MRRRSFNALRQLDEYLRALESGVATARDVLCRPPASDSVSFGSPTATARIHSRATCAILSVAIDKANAFVDYALPDSTSSILADAEELFRPDLTSPSPSDSMMGMAEKHIITMMYAYDVNARFANYCGFDVPGFGPSPPSPASLAPQRAEARATEEEARAERAEYRRKSGLVQGQFRNRRDGQLGLMQERRSRFRRAPAAPVSQRPQHGQLGLMQERRSRFRRAPAAPVSQRLSTDSSA